MKLESLIFIGAGAGKHLNGSATLVKRKTHPRSSSTVWSARISPPWVCRCPLWPSRPPSRCRTPRPCPHRGIRLWVEQKTYGTGSFFELFLIKNKKVSQNRSVCSRNYFKIMGVFRIGKYYNSDPDPGPSQAPFRSGSDPDPGVKRG